MKALQCRRAFNNKRNCLCWPRNKMDDVVVVRMLARSLLVSLVAVVLVVVPDGSEAFIAGCWKDWSRCSKWSSWLTGKFWPDCNSHCKNMGLSGGKCVEVPSTCYFVRGTVLQCQCDYGRPPRARF